MARSPVMYQSPRMQFAVASGLRQYSLNSPDRTPRRQLDGDIPFDARRHFTPFVIHDPDRNPGLGLPIEPGFTGMGGKFATRITVSVWP